MNKSCFLRALILLVVLSVTPVFAQTKKSRCKIGNTTYICLKDFRKLASVDSTTDLFRTGKGDDLLYLFVAIPSGPFDDTKIRETIAGYYSKSEQSKFKWKSVKDPLAMDIDTKYTSKLVSNFGIADQFLLEVKFFKFDVKGSEIVIGYASNIGYTNESGNAEIVNRALFDKGEGLSDSAVGCNAVATILNSITKEFKEKDQGCTLTVLSSPKL